MILVPAVAALRRMVGGGQHPVVRSEFLTYIIHSNVFASSPICMPIIESFYILKFYVGLDYFNSSFIVEMTCKSLKANEN